MTYLLVAEVDKIQTFILQSSKLRQVVGASAMLEKFGEEVKAQPLEFMGTKPIDVLSSGGGNFRILFKTEDETIRAGRALRRKFEAEIGGSMTVAPPINADETENLIADGNQALREAKLANRSPLPIWHMPFHALCASSGVELADAYTTETNIADDTTEKYLGPLTRRKGQFGNEENPVLCSMLKALNGFHSNVVLPPYATDAETYTSDTDRNYVAYMVADGNGMGTIFGQCNENQLKIISNNLTSLTMHCLAEAAHGLIAIRDQREEMPLLPLIVGGDDVFVLMPAKQALSVAAEFCEIFEHKISAFMHCLGVNTKVTMSAAVVVCKSSYPFKAAHEHGEDLLKKVKDEAKSGQSPRSMVSMDLIIGSDSTRQPHRHIPDAYSLGSARCLIEYRYALNGIPSRIREQMRIALEDDDKQRLQDIILRFGELYGEEPKALLQTAWANLTESHLLALFNLWDFLFDVNRYEIKYREGTIYADQT